MYRYLVLLVLFHSVYSRNINSRLIGGDEVLPNSIPYQALVELRNTRDIWFCGGILISQSHVITSASCVNTFSGVLNEGIVSLGVHNGYFDDPTEITFYAPIITHFKSSNSYLPSEDIALSIFPRPVELSAAVQIAVLPKRADADKTYSGTVGTLSGWGWHKDSPSNFRHLSTALQSTKVQITPSPDVCRRVFPGNELKIPLDHIICASSFYENEFVGACAADLGGPLTIDGVVVGLLIASDKKCQLGYPSAFVNLPVFYDWISSNSDLVFD